MDGKQFRRLGPDDTDFLHAMFLETVTWREDAPRRTLEAVLDNPDLARYVAGWGRPGDAGIVALSESGERLGAAWYRLFGASDHGYGFVAPEAPELGIAVRPEYRRRRLGRLLMDSLIQLAVDEGRPALSLSVEEANSRALRLYENLGFIQVERVAGALTMLLRLRPSLVRS